MHFVAIFEFGFVALLDIFTPSDGLPLFDWSDLLAGESEDWHVYAFSLAWVVAESIVEPFYVAAGFSLYLNRRSELEGWDIEVAFRRMAARQMEISPPAGSPLARTAMIALLAVSLSWALAGPLDAVAAEAIDPPPDAAAPATGKRPSGAIRQAAEQVLADPVFGHQVEDTSWRLRDQAKNDKADMPWWAQQLSRLAGLLASGARGLIYLLIFVAAAALLVLLYRYRHLAFGQHAPPLKRPDTLFGLDLRPASLPDDIAGAALAELDAGRATAALSLLYRGTLVALIRRQHIEFRAGDTEDICLHRVSGRIDAPAAVYFAQLLDAWKRTAYAESPPDATSAHALCQHWAQHFAEPGRTA